MMIALLLNILKKLAPVLLIAGLFAAVYWQGYSAASKRHLEYVTKLNAESEMLLKQAKQRNADIQAQAEQSANIIGETYDANHQTITHLATANAELVAKLRQQSTASSGKSRLSNTASAAKFSNAPDTGNGEFLESFVDQARIADETAETARACQSTLITYQEAINGSTSAIN